MARLPHGEFSETFTVEEFRPATFEVELAAKEKEAFAGSPLSLSSFGRYFYGAPVRSADVKLRVHSRARTPAFDGYEGAPAPSMFSAWPGAAAGQRRG